MSTGPKTIKEAQALPEMSRTEFWTGKVFIGAAGVDGDTIALFLDTDGSTKKPECIRRTPEGPDEWVKVLW